MTMIVICQEWHRKMQQTKSNPQTTMIAAVMMMVLTMKQKQERVLEGSVDHTIEKVNTPDCTIVMGKCQMVDA
jgi:isocitrate/isopropylmalate dehydrogenase